MGKIASSNTQDALDAISVHIGTHFVSFKIETHEEEFINTISIDYESKFESPFIDDLKVFLGKVLNSSKAKKVTASSNPKSKDVKNINNFVKGIHFTKIKNNMLNVEKCMLSKSKKRAKEQNLLYNLDEDYIKSIFPLDNCCPVFGIKFIYADKMKTASLDKIIPELGYVKGNVQILSKKANTIKSNYTIQELIEVIDCFRSYYNKTGTGIIL